MAKVIRFSREEALSKMGKNIELKAGYFLTPMGCQGKVIGLHQYEQDAYNVIIGFLKAPFGPTTHEFGKGPYEKSIKELA